MTFEWDENKNLANIKNHEGISFEDATKVFDDIWAIDIFDDSHSTEEDRYVIVGLSEFTLLRVIFTIRQHENDGEIIRIISAWKATGKDKENYEKARNEFDR
jgi:uncharacterized DUF497 family protein